MINIVYSNRGDPLTVQVGDVIYAADELEELLTTLARRAERAQAVVVAARRWRVAVEAPDGVQAAEQALIAALKEVDQ